MDKRDDNKPLSTVGGIGGIRPGISRRAGHMEPADRRKSWDDLRKQQQGGK